MNIKRRKSRVIKIGKVKIGGDNPVAIQSMTKVPAKNIRATIAQINSLAQEGCSIVRVAVLDKEDAAAITQIKKGIKIPLVADIHFNWELAMLAITAGADKIRLNPGNIYKEEEVKKIVALARDHAIPIRVGLNSGSLPRIVRYDPKLSAADKMLKGAAAYIKLLESLNFKNIVVSLKCSGVLETIAAYNKFSGTCDYPLHLGLTATGYPEEGKVKSSICLGSLLLNGIGDTMRVSLTSAPEEEIVIAKYILSSLGLGNFGPEIISCPTCGRTEVDVKGIVDKLHRKLSSSNLPIAKKPVKLAVMGCVVNGPGEAEGADLAIAFGRKEGLLYRNAVALRKVSGDRAVEELIKEYKKLCLRK